MYFRRRPRDEYEKYGPRSILHAGEVAAAIVSWLLAVAAAFVIILVETWLGIALIALSLAAYFLISVLHIGSSRRRVADQLADFERRKSGQGS